MRHSFKLWIYILGLLLPTLVYGDDAPQLQSGLTDKDILSYIQDVISWRRALVDSDLLADNARVTLLKDTLKVNSQKALKSSFDFAHAESALIDAQNPADKAQDANNSHHNNLVKRIADTNQHIDELQKQIAALSSDSEDLPDREKLKGDLKVEQAHLALLNDFMGIYNADDSEDEGLAGEINKLSYSVMGDLNEPSAAKPDSKEVQAAQDSGDDSIFDIASDLIALAKKKKAINGLVIETSDLTASNQRLLKIIRTSLQDGIKQGNALADTPVTADRKSLDAHHRALDLWQVSFQKLSATAIPLGQASTLLDTTRADLKEWDAILDQKWDKIVHRFLVRFGILCVSLVVPFILLEFAFRAILRYTKDKNRLRQLHIVKQALFVTLLVTVFFLNFFTEFGSIATYAGFLTAGLAVALQTVLVSLTAHFFFFGRFGVKAGDRVTIAGVNGDVVQVGILRIYLMELIGDKDALRPSGKIVAFPNSVLFNSTAFSKQITGTSYTWNDLTFLLDPDSDFSLANKRVLEVVTAAYQEYKKTIERQYVSLEQSTHLAVGLPAPRSEVRIKDNGLSCDVHYPVTLEQASRVYEDMIKKLIKAFSTDKDFKLVLTTPMKLVARNQAIT